MTDSVATGGVESAGAAELAISVGFSAVVLAMTSVAGEGTSDVVTVAATAGAASAGAALSAGVGVAAVWSTDCEANAWSSEVCSAGVGLFGSLLSRIDLRWLFFRRHFQSPVLVTPVGWGRSGPLPRVLNVASQTRRSERMKDKMSVEDGLRISERNPLATAQAVSFSVGAGR